MIFYKRLVIIADSLPLVLACGKGCVKPTYLHRPLREITAHLSASSSRLSVRWVILNTIIATRRLVKRRVSPLIHGLDQVFLLEEVVATARAPLVSRNIPLWHPAGACTKGCRIPLA